MLSLVGTLMGLRTARRLEKRRLREALKNDGETRETIRFETGLSASARRRLAVLPSVSAAAEGFLRPAAGRRNPGNHGIQRHRELRAERARRDGARRRVWPIWKPSWPDVSRCWPSSPPRFGVDGADIWVAGEAAGLAGPRRAAVGGVRDFVLGARIIDGRGEVLRFGGEVMKNIAAGYDVSRCAGSLGTLGLIVEVSLKVLPRPVAEATLRFARWTKPRLCVSSMPGW